MAFWSDNRGIDGIVQASDRTLNVLVVIFLAAFALGTVAYYYGQLNPRVPGAAPTASTTPVPAAPAG